MFIISNLSKAQNLTNSQIFYGHISKIATLGFHELKGEYYYRESIGRRENFENVKITKDEDG